MRLFLEYAGSAIELPLGDTIIGRGHECRLRLSDRSVSRIHARLELSPSGAYIRDLDSRNGTRLNGRRFVGGALLADGDCLYVGNCAIYVRVVANDEDIAVPDTINRLGEWREDAQVTLKGEEDTGNELADDDVTPALSPPLKEGAEARGESSWYHAVHKHQPEHTGRGTFRSHKDRVASFPVVYSSDSLTFDTEVTQVANDCMFLTSLILDPPGTLCQLTIGGEKSKIALTLAGVVERVVQEAEGRSPSESGLEVRLVNLSASDRILLNRILRPK